LLFWRFRGRWFKADRLINHNWTETRMSLGLVGQATALFALTNIDDIVVLAVFFGLARGGSGNIRVILGQYIGFAGILAASVVGALGAGLLPEAVLPYLGLLPLILGLRAAWTVWRVHRRTNGNEPESKTDEGQGDGGESGPYRQPGVMSVAAATFANGGDNIGVYVPVFATSGAGGIVTYIIVFLLLVAVWCAAGWFFASRPVVARALSRWGHIVLPVVLIAIGLIILIEGGVFGL
jgi:cadmium resistance protein CadD (predicted permease)